MRHNSRLFLILLLLLSALLLASCGSGEQTSPSSESTPSKTSTAETAKTPTLVEPTGETPETGEPTSETPAPEIKVMGVKISKSELNMVIGDTTKVSAVFTPAKPTDKSVTWSSSDPDVAKVDNIGVVTAISEGDAVLTVTTGDGGFTATCKVNVKAKIIPLKSIKIKEKTLDLYPDESKTLTIELLPENVTYKNVVFESSNPTIVSVDKSGTVKATRVGTVTITARHESSWLTDTCVINVVPLPVEPTGVTLNKTSLNLKISETYQLEATVLPAHARSKEVTFSSSDESIVTVDGKTGKLTAIAEGSAVITVTTVDGGKTSTCAVHVIPGKNEDIDKIDLSNAGKILDLNGYAGGLRKKTSGEILFSPNLPELRNAGDFYDNYEDYLGYVRFTMLEAYADGASYTFPSFTLQPVKSKGDWVDFFMLGEDVDCGFCPVVDATYEVELVLVKKSAPDKAVLYGTYTMTPDPEIEESPFYRPDYGPGRQPGEFYIRYIAGEHGSISGNATQIVSGTVGSTEVVAVPDEGYAFFAWSDGVKTAARSGDTALVDKKIYAYFTIDAGDTGIPSMYIFTDSGDPVTSKNYEGAKITVTGADDFNFDDLTIQIRGRGNSSWSGSSRQTSYDSKNSYRIKFDEKIQLLGMGENKNKDWVLNSNKFDLSGLRNYLVWTLANKMGTIPFVPECRWVQLYVNNEYRGMYMVTELIEVAKDRVNVDDKVAGTDKGFLIEFDFRGNYDDKPYFYLPDYGPDPNRELHSAVEIVIKSKITNEVNDWGVKLYDQDEIAAIENYLKQCNKAVFSGDREAIEELIDLPSFIDMYILEELSKDCDVGRASWFVQKNPGGKLFCTAPWDFDFGFGTYGPATGTWGFVSDGEKVSPWYGSLIYQEWFREAVVARMKELQTALNETLEEVQNKANELSAAADLNAYFWDMYGRNFHQYVSSQVSGNLYSYQEHIDFLKDWTETRWDIMIEMLEDFD